MRSLSSAFFVYCYLQKLQQELQIISLLLLMVKISLVLLQIVISINLMAQHTVKFNIRSLPQYHSPGSDIYIAGSFNGWNPQDAAYRFSKDTKGNYSFTFSL